MGSRRLVFLTQQLGTAQGHPAPQELGGHRRMSPALWQRRWRWRPHLVDDRKGEYTVHWCLTPHRFAAGVRLRRRTLKCQPSRLAKWPTSSTMSLKRRTTVVRCLLGVANCISSFIAGWVAFWSSGQHKLTPQTFTSQAAIKEGNRACERLLRDVEYFATLASLGSGAYEYPKYVVPGSCHTTDKAGSSWTRFGRTCCSTSSTTCCPAPRSGKCARTP